MIGTVDLAVTVLAGAADHARVLRAAAQLGLGILVTAEELPGVQ